MHYTQVFQWTTRRQGDDKTAGGTVLPAARNGALEGWRVRMTLGQRRRILEMFVQESR